LGGEGGERYQAVLDKLAELTNWKSKEKNSGWGIALTECFKSIVGEAVKVSKNSEGKVKIDKVIAVMDCGWYVNPDIIRAQVEGSVFMAYGAAAVHATNFKDGKAVEHWGFMEPREMMKMMPQPQPSDDKMKSK
jgi:isoquinoline 1-oxidoreductase beta subunit